MIRAILFGLVCLALPFNTLARTVEDSAGRLVEVPDHIERVYAAGPPASILVYVLAPDKLTGWSRALRDEEKPYIAQPYRNLPETGRLTGRGGSANIETVLNLDPDLIIDFGSVKETYVSLANRVQEQIGIPYLLIDGRFENTPQALRLLGEVLGVSERAEQLADYVERLFTWIDTGLAEIPTNQRPRVYLARGPAGLETGLKGSINTEIIERAGGRNVADPGDESIRRGLVQASIEQVIVANPDTIITWDEHFFRAVWNDPLWAEVDAVKRGRIFLSPSVPFGWIDRPPSINRVIGLLWLAGLFFPEQLNFDLREETRIFYRTFYQVKLKDSELDQLIQWTGDPTLP